MNRSMIENWSTNGSNHWFSSSFLLSSPSGLNDSHYSNCSSNQQMTDIAIHGNSTGEILNHSNYSLDFRYVSKDPTKRSSGVMDDKSPIKRSRLWSPFDTLNSLSHEFRPNYANDYYSRNSPIDLLCRVCDSLCHSRRDFLKHLKGKRHQSNLSLYDHSMQSKGGHRLQKLLDNKKDAIVGLDFIKQIRKTSTSKETDFVCLLCNSHNMSTDSAFRHINGIKHQKKYIEFIQSDEKLNPFDSSKECQLRSRDICVILREYESLYGRGQCRFIKRSSLQSRDESRFKDIGSRESSKSKGLDHNCKSNDLQSVDKAIEAFKTIRNVCNQLIAYYSPQDIKRKSVSRSDNSQNLSIDSNK
ncbi:zinc finger protein 318-like [Oppia nitens]|uniref:zinc finger protein 318-like n=1 Tax=Oppia nitens TaxID=1686743 RepID=UPI0023DB50AD|nr:zinc finger protein 318-like [Oppia nitens]